MVFETLAQYALWGNTGQDYAYAIAIFIGALIVLRFFKFFIVKNLERLFKKTKTEIDDIIIHSIDHIGWMFYVILSLYIALQFVVLPEIAENIVYYIILIAVVYYAVKFVHCFIEFGTKKYIEKRKREEKDADTTAISLLGRIAKGALWGVALILILSNLGYDVSALLAGLGIGGIAIAFALQNVLSDIFASFSIYFDKPFKVGDFIIIGDDMGVVKKIGIKSTKLESLWGNDIIVSNRELTSIRIHNYRTMKKRRVVLPFGVVYETPQKKLEKIPGMIKEIFKGVKLAEIDRVHMKSFAASSLDFEIVYYVDTGDYGKHMDIQQQILLGIKERFEKENIEFAYPTQTLFLNKQK